MKVFGATSPDLGEPDRWLCAIPHRAHREPADYFRRMNFQA